MNKVLKWSGTWPANCDLCGKALKEGAFFIDGRTKLGPWALMCNLCHTISGVGLGLGKGQLYESKTLEKILDIQPWRG